VFVEVSKWKVGRKFRAKRRLHKKGSMKERSNFETLRLLHLVCLEEKMFSVSENAAPESPPTGGAEEVLGQLLHTQGKKLLLVQVGNLPGKPRDTWHTKTLPSFGAGRSPRWCSDI